MMFEERSKPNFNYYQIANADAETVKAGFVVRQYEYSVIEQDLLKHPKDLSVQHFLLVGRRGSGKSTLLRRLQIEINTNAELAESYIAINLAEEQANVYRLFDLLEEVMRELEFRGFKVQWPGDEDISVYTNSLFSVIHSVLEEAGKKLVLLLDNIDRILDNIGEESLLLRAHLQNYHDLKIIGGSTRISEHFWSYGQPFYEFFRVMPLRPLNNEEIKTLLMNWSEKLKEPKLKDFADNRPGQLETIRLLTDGLPRTLQFFVNILLTRDQGTGFDYLRLLMSDVTPLYQERLNNLSPAQRRIVLQMAFAWESVGARELSLATRMETKLISAHLSQMIDKGVAEKVPTGTKNHLYRLSERFFNLWLIFTQGGPRERRRARYLSIFLENFYDERELMLMAQKHEQDIENGRLGADKTVLLTKAFAQVKYVLSFQRDSLINKTLQLGDLGEAMKKELPLSIAMIIGGVKKMIDERKWGEAMDLAQSIEQEDGVREMLLGFVHLAKGEPNKMEKAFLKAFSKGNILALDHLASYYVGKQQYEQAVKYSRKALEHGSKESAYWLCFHFYLNNVNKSEVGNMLRSGKYTASTDHEMALLPILKAWTGLFDDLEEEVARVVRQGYEHLRYLLFHLVVHRQSPLVHRLFQSEEFGQALFERFMPLYYANLLFLPDMGSFSIRVPPELSEAIEHVCKSILGSQECYYGMAG